MPLNEKRIVEIIREQIDQVPERCPGYRDELLQTITNIIRAERNHSVQATYIQKQINEECAGLGGYLADHRDQPDVKIDLEDQ